jgi:hypothetical protein
LTALSVQAEEAPAGSVLDIRIQQSISSYVSKKGTEVRGVLVAPVRRGDRIVLPMGTRVFGSLLDVQRVGVGLVRETASVQIDFNRIELPGSRVVPIKSRLMEVDNARERVDSKGRIRGIRATGTIAHRASGFVASFAAFDPIALAFTMASMSSLLRFSEPEIYLPAGAEFLVRLEEPVGVEETFESSIPAVAGSPAQRALLRAAVRKLPFRTSSMKSGAPSDITNLLFAGRRAALERAFASAGWVRADVLSAGTAYRALRSWTENQGYGAAHMSTLLLDEREPDYSYSKTLNTFAKRHHVRIWRREETWHGETLWTAASTQDIAISFKGRTHAIDQHVDNERAKVVNDLILTGCVDGLDLMNRSWVPREATNAIRERLITDGAIAILHINDCEQPSPSLEIAAAPPPRGSAGQRIVRQSVLTFKNDLVRGNVIWRGAEGVRYLVSHSKPRDTERPVRDIEIAPDAFSPERALLAHTREEEEAMAESMILPSQSAGPTITAAPRWTPPLVELGLSGGSLSYGSSLGGVGLTLVPKNPAVMSVNHKYDNLLDPGWTLAPMVTINAHRRISHELAFIYQRGQFRLGPSTATQVRNGREEASTGLLTQQFSYSALFHALPKESRIRPYFAVGPVLQMIRLTGTPMSTASGVFRFGLRDIGIIRAAYDFGSRSPLEGGAIYQPGFHYGAGVKYRVTPRWMLRCDMRETMSAQPRFWSKATNTPEPGTLEPLLTITPTPRTGMLRQQRITLGFAFTF